jgi:hypothetical protein
VTAGRRATPPVHGGVGLWPVTRGVTRHRGPFTVGTGEAAGPVASVRTQTVPPGESPEGTPPPAVPLR